MRVWAGFVMRRTLSDCRKQSGKIMLASTALAGNGTVTVANLKWSDTEYYQRDRHGDYVQEMK